MLISGDFSQGEMIEVHPSFLDSYWYRVSSMFKKNQAPPRSSTTQARFIKLKDAKFCILNGYLDWKDKGGILLNCPWEKEAKEKMQEFHKGDCGGHLYWTTTTHQILRAGFY